MRPHVVRRVTIAAALASLSLASTAVAASDQYVVRNLVSSSAAVPADRVDPNIKNAWGLVSSPTSPWWPANNGTNTSTIIPATGAINNTVVQVAGGPTGIVWNGTAGAFPITGGQSNFIFNTMSGAISGWRAGAASEVKVPAHDAFYMGLALRGHRAPARSSTPPTSSTTRSRSTTPSGRWSTATSSSTRRCPRATAAYGIQTIGNRIFVTYAQQQPAPVGREIPGAGKGYVSAFDLAGNFLARVASAAACSTRRGAPRQGATRTSAPSAAIC